MKRKNLRYILLSVLALAVVALACGPTPASKPTVAIVAPLNGARVAVGQTVEVQFRAEDAQAVAWVKMEVAGAVVATMQSPAAEGQKLLEGILRWTPAQPGSHTLVVTAQSVADQASAPAAVTVEVLDASAGLPQPTSVPTPVPPAGQPAATAKATTPVQPTATTKPGAPAAAVPTQLPTGVPTQPPTAVPTQLPTGVPTQPPTAVPTNVPTPVPTSVPTSVPTKVPTSVPTTVPSPQITEFYANGYAIGPGQCLTIYWKTSHASQVTLNAQVVSLNGDHTVCFDDIGVGATTFELQASGGGETAVRTLQIDGVGPQVFSAPFVPGMSGSVCENGDVNALVAPGDDWEDEAWISFITFNLLSFPGDSKIKEATLDLGPCTVSHYPFSLGGQMYVNYRYYADLDGGDYAAYYAEGAEYLGSVYGCPSGTIDVTASVNIHKRDAYYQVALVMAKKTNDDAAMDYVRYTSPSLTITYVP
jgi:hypothetical protein